MQNMQSWEKVAPLYKLNKMHKNNDTGWSKKKKKKKTAILSFSNNLLQDINILLRKTNIQTNKKTSVDNFEKYRKTCSNLVWGAVALK